jgi:hypothetical protein
MNWRQLSGAAKAALVFAVLGFLLGFTTTNTTSINGVTTCSYMDYGALVFGALAMLAGSAGLMNLRSIAAEARNFNIAVLLGADLVGVLHVLRGIGMVGGPCG